MKEFFKMMFATVAGFIFSAILLGIFGLIFLFALIAFVTPDQTVNYENGTILKVELNYNIPERSGYGEFNSMNDFFNGFNKRLGLNDIIRSIENAAYDEKIDAIYLDLNNLNVPGFAAASAIRRSLVDFREAGKTIFAHGDDISQLGYFIATAANKIYLTPTGNIELKGFGARMMYFKGTLDKLGIEAQIFRKGKFKSAVEIFSESGMSNADKEQLSELLKSVQKEYFAKISESRNISSETLEKLYDDFEIRTPESALKYKLIDSLCYLPDVFNTIEAKNSIKIKDKILTLKKYSRVPGRINESTSNRIAVVYATGEITESPGSENEIGTENIIEGIKKAVENRNVKAIVLRVNSPGGSSLTSDLIWKAVTEAKKTKPVIVSMGSVAASGGYYISCAADSIVAEYSTITGSIGVFGMIPNVKDFLNNKAGITVDGINTGKYSDFKSIFRPVTQKEREFIEEDIDRVYDDFISRVSEGRNISKSDVDKIAQGRVWSGADAKEIGLVDELGGLDKAIEIAAAKAGILSYRILEYPEIEDPFEAIADFFTDEAETSYLKYKLGDEYVYYKILKRLKSAEGIKARLPYELEIY